MYLYGARIIGIQRQLVINGVLSPSGKDAWGKRSIEQILQNEKYIGDAAVFKTYSISSKRVINNDGSHEQFIIKGSHPAIITQEIFDAVQQIRNYRSNVYRDEVGSHRKKHKVQFKAKYCQ
jgi:site-specific DNA recombinase